MVEVLPEDSALVLFDPEDKRGGGAAGARVGLKEVGSEEGVVDGVAGVEVEATLVMLLSWRCGPEDERDGVGEGLGMKNVCIPILFLVSSGPLIFFKDIQW